MIRQILTKVLPGSAIARLTRRERMANTQMFDNIIEYEGIKRTFLRSLNSQKPVHILLVGPPGQAKTLFLKSIFETVREKRSFFIVGGNASKSGLIDVLFDLRPRYLLVDEIEYLKSEYQTILLSLMETGIMTQTLHNKLRQTHLKMWVFATSNGIKRLSEPLVSIILGLVVLVVISWAADGFACSMEYHKRVQSRDKRLE